MCKPTLYSVARFGGKAKQGAGSKRRLCTYTDVEFQCRWCVLATLSVKPEVYFCIKLSAQRGMTLVAHALNNFLDSKETLAKIQNLQDKFRITGLHRTKYGNTGITGFTGHVGAL